MFNPLDRPSVLRWLALAHRLRRSLARRRNGSTTADSHRTTFYERAWRDAATQLGATVTDFGDGIQEITLGPARTRVRRNYTSLDDPVTLAVAGHKPLVCRLLAQQGLPVPRSASFTLDDLRPALGFLDRAGGPCVVKPAKDTGAGQGVTTGVTTEGALARAAAVAASFGSELMVEEQREGDVYRLLYLDGELLDAIVRRRPTIVGDGRASVRQLVNQSNAERLARGFVVGQTLLSVDLDVRHTLARQGLSLASVPPAGRVVTLKTVCNENAAADNYPAAPLLCRSLVEVGARAAAAVGARLAGVDMITTDPGVPLAASGGAVIEVNTTPGYYYHYHRSGAPAEVAVPILRRLLGSPPQCGAGEASGAQAGGARDWPFEFEGDDDCEDERSPAEPSTQH